MPLVAGRLPDLGKYHHVALALQVFQRDEGHLGALLGGNLVDAHHVAGQYHVLAGISFVDVAAEAGDDPRQIDGHLLQWMRRDEDAQQLLLERQTLFGRHWRHIFQPQAGRRSRSSPAKQIEHRKLASLFRLVPCLADADHLIHGVQQLRPPAKLVQRADLDQTLQRLFANLAQIDTLAEVFQSLERAAVLAGIENRLHRSLADVLDSSQTVANGCAWRNREGVADA